MSESVSDKDLWRMYRSARRPERPERPDPVLLAAYLDGALDDEAAEPVELWLAGDSSAAEELAVLRSGLEAGGAAEVPERVIARAQAIVHAPAAPAREPARGSLDWFTWPKAASWAAVAALAVVVSGAGFELGGDHGGDIMTLLSGDLGTPSASGVEQARLDFGEPPADFL
jgi:anti-sigma factor RsiW